MDKNKTDVGGLTERDTLALRAHGDWATQQGAHAIARDLHGLAGRIEVLSRRAAADTSGLTRWALIGSLMNPHPRGAYVRIEDVRDLLATNAGSEPYGYHYEWAACITTEGPQGFKWKFDKERPADWAIEDGQARNVTPLFTTPQQPAEAGASLLDSEELTALRRFAETCEDGEGYDVDFLMMCRLAEIGVIRRVGNSKRFEFTKFGAAALTTPASPTAEVVRDQALEEAAKACEAWGRGKVEKWAGDTEMSDDAKARAWDALQCAAAIRALRSASKEQGK